MLKIIQWNARSAISNKGSLEYCLFSQKIDVALIAETWFHPNKYVNFKGYNVIRRDRDDGKAGVAILIRNSIPYTVVSNVYQVNNVFNVVISLKVSRNKWVTITSLYSVPTNHISRLQWNALFNSIPKPAIIAGDFNCPHQAFGYSFSKPKGQALMDAIEDNNLIILNDGSPTLVKNLRYVNDSAPDVTLCSGDLVECIEWNVMDDPMGSNHFPIMMNYFESGTVTHQNEMGTFGPKWSIHKANWNVYNTAMEEYGRTQPNTQLDYGDFIQQINIACEKSIPRLRPRHTQRPVWWNEDCLKLVKDRKEAFMRFKNQPNLQHYIDYQRSAAKVKKVIRESKKSSWMEFCNSLHRSTPVKDIWSRIKQLKNMKTCERPPMDEGSWCEEFLDALAPPLVTQDISIQTSNPQSDDFFLASFSIGELEAALKNNINTAPGWDNIHYPMLRNLPPNCKGLLLDIFNRIWHSGSFPVDWKKNIVVPIQKPGKPSELASSYRGISLSSCVFKTFERMIKLRLEWWVEFHNKLPNSQYGSRKGKSTYNNLCNFITDVQLGFTSNKFTLAAFLDISGAFDCVQLPILISKMEMIGLPHEFSTRVVKMLSDREIYLKINKKIYGRRTTRRGLPQGGTLSPVLYAIYVSELENILPAGVRILQYVDDILLYVTNGSIENCTAIMDEAIWIVNNWAQSLGLDISQSKSVICPFTRRRAFPLPEEVEFGGISFSCKPSTTFLGLKLDRKLRWTEHLTFLVGKVEKYLNILRMVCHNKWGADPKIALTFYRATIRAVIDYGSVFYGDASKCSLLRVDRVQYKALRLCTGFLRSTPIIAMLAELNEMPLGIRRQFLADRLILRLFASDTSTYSKINSLNTKVRSYSYWRTKTPPLLTNSCNSYTDYTGFVYSNTLSPIFLNTYNKLFYLPKVTLLNDYSQITPSEANQTFLNDINSMWEGWDTLYTDGSKMDDALGCAFWDDKRRTTRAFKLPNCGSIYTAELTAIIKALDYIKLSDSRSVVIFSDSQSSLLSLQASYKGKPNHLVVEILSKLYDLEHEDGKRVELAWVKAHAGVRGNETADTAAKQASIDGEPSGCSLPYTDVFSVAKRKALEKWHDTFISIDKGRFYKQVNPDIGKLPWFYHISLPRNAVRSLCRMRTNHGLSKAYKHRIGIENSPNCDECQQMENFEHVVMTCPKFNIQRHRLFTKYISIKNNTPSFKDFLKCDDEKITIIFIEFIRDTGITI